MNSHRTNGNNLNINKHFVRWGVGILLAILAVQAILSMRQKSVTTDEIMYIAAGYYHLKTGDFQMNMTNPPLMKMISAVPLLFIDLEIPPIIGTVPKDMDLIEQWQFARSFLYQNRTGADYILFLARLPVIAISIILGLYLFKWSKELYGDAAGLFALLLYSFSPNILAHSRLATQDLALTAFMFISTYYFWRFMQRSQWKYLILCGIFFGLGMLTKSVAILTLPAFTLYGIVTIYKKNNQGIPIKFPFIARIDQSKMRLRLALSLVLALILIGIIGMIVINIGYGFQGSLSPISAEVHQKIYDKLPDSDLIHWAARNILMLPIPLPSPYVRSLIFQASLSSTQGIYFAGQHYDHSLWYLVIMSFLIKTPIPISILCIASLVLLLFHRESLNTEWLIAFSIAIPLLLFSYASNAIGGVRYLLPIYPFIILLISRLISDPIIRRRLGGALILGLSIWYIFSTINIYPHYLAYFNELIGGPQNGYKYLTDSNIDWGQDLKLLKQYMTENDIETIKLAYNGSAEADYYDIDYEYLPSVGLAPKKPGQLWWFEIDPEDKPELPPQQGTIAISATILASPGWMEPLFYDSYEWLRSHEPIDQVGYSILIYEID